MTETEEELEKNKLVRINPGILAKVTCISINKSILQKYASEDVSLGSWFIGLEVKHIDEHVLLQVGFRGEVVLKDYSGLLKKWDLMLLSGAKVDLGLGYGLLKRRSPAIEGEIEQRRRARAKATRCLVWIGARIEGDRRRSKARSSKGDELERRRRGAWCGSELGSKAIAGDRRRDRAKATSSSEGDAVLGVDRSSDRRRSPAIEGEIERRRRARAKATRCLVWIGARIEGDRRRSKARSSEGDELERRRRGAWCGSELGSKAIEGEIERRRRGAWTGSDV
nr:beta-1,3-galactosyltransferase 7 [Quercus suber]